MFNVLEVSHPFAVAVYGEQLYWDDWTRKSIFAANKNSGGDKIYVQKDFPGTHTYINIYFL